MDFDAVERAVTLLNDKTGATRARGETITVATSDDPAFPAVVSTLSASSAKVNAKDDGSFLGVFAAGNTDGKRATVSPALSDLPVYSASLIGCLILALLLFLETLSAGGARIPFFSREAGGTEDEKR